MAIAASSFEAHIIAERLRSADIDAFVFDTATAGLGVAFRPGASEIPVQVAAEDEERARAELARDLGFPDDEAPGGPTFDEPAIDEPPSDHQASDCEEAGGADRGRDRDAGRGGDGGADAAMPEWARPRPRMPWPARITFALTVVVVLVTLIGAFVMLFL